MGEVENGYTFRMGDHEMTMRDSFTSMLDDRQLTDCILVCPANQGFGRNTDHSNDCNADKTNTTNSNSSNSNSNSNSNNQLTNGHTSNASKTVTRSQTSKNEMNNTNNNTGSNTNSNTNTNTTNNNNNHIIRTHRVILSASSDYFRSIFASVYSLNTGVIAVIVSNVEFEDLDSIVEFIYKGQVSVGQSRIHKFLAAAQLLMVKGLMNIKLVSNDNQPIDENTCNDQEIHRLKNEIKDLKESEKLKMDRIRREVEEDLKKKFELEKSALTEAKKRFEAEKMKFTIDKECFEKSKHIFKNDNQNKSQTESNKLQNKSESTSPSTTTALQTNIDLDLIANESQSTPNSVAKNVQSLNRTIGAQPQSPQKPSDSSVKKAINYLSESPNETEGRQLRKRIKISDSAESTKTPKSGEISKIDDDEDGEIYEVDFSGLVPQQSDQKSQETGVGEARQRFSAALVGGSAANENNNANVNINNVSSSPSSRAIVASTLAFHHSIGVSQSSTPTQNNTRTLRRSTSSHGSASTQSMTGENGNDITSVEGIQRRKGPGRTPHWFKEQENNNNDTREGSPETRARKQRSSQDFNRQSGALYSCPYCPQVYHGNQSMQDHINGIHLNSKQQYICDYCGKVYTWRISLNKHLKTAHPNEPIE